MKILIFILGLTIFTQYQSFAQTEFDLDPLQSMLMTGKGPGQDGAINPFAGQDCYAIVENMGKNEFSIRIQQNGEILDTVPVSKHEKKKVKLLKGHELYLDAEAQGKVRAKVDFEQMEQ